MKLIQAMKQLKDLNVKAADLREKVGKNCALLTIETPTYKDQEKQIQEWIQAHHDVLREIMRLRLAVQRTNLLTSVTIELEGKMVTKSLAAWIHRRRDLALQEMQMWGSLGDRNLKESNVKTSPDGQVTEIRIKRFFDPELRDKRVAAYRSEPSIIDGTLEVVNATTDLMEDPPAEPATEAA